MSKPSRWRRLLEYLSWSGTVWSAATAPPRERLGDPLEGEDPRERAVSLVVEDENGARRPGWRLRAGDFIEQTDYDHGRQVLTVRTSSRPVPWRLQLRRWWEGRR